MLGAPPSPAESRARNEPGDCSFGERHDVQVPRLLAFAIDWLAIAAWGALLFVLVLLANDGGLPPPPSAAAGQAMAFLAMTLPVTTYFALFESSRWQASLGKRVLRLRVSDTAGHRLTLARAFLRNAVKFLPWECGHIAAHQAIVAGPEGPPLWVYVPMAIACAVPVWWFTAMLVRGRTPYDAWLGVRVGRTDSTGTAPHRA